MNFHRCRDCGSEFENDPEQGGAEKCPDCDSHDILPLKTNFGFIEQDSNGEYSLDLVDFNEAEEDEREDEEPGSLFDKRKFNEEGDRE